MLWSSIAGSRRHWTLIAAHGAGDATTHHPIFVFPCNGRLRSVTLVAGAAITGQNSNTFNLNLINLGTDGTGTTELANRDFVSGVNLSSGSPTSLYAPATPLDCAAGIVISLQRELAGSGLATPAILVIVDWDTAKSS